MGYIAHEAIVVTGWNTDYVTKVHEKAVELGCTVSPMIDSPVNGYCSFLVVPDGSKEGWGASTEGDYQRENLINWIDEQQTLYVDYCEVRFGGDDPDQAEVTRHNW